MSVFPFQEQFFRISGPMLDLHLIEINDGDGKAIPFYYWSIILRATGEKIGAISLRIGYNYHSYYNGNVGYEIEKPFRGHHFAYYACRMLEPVAWYHGMDHLIFSCDYDNAASCQTIERLGASLLETVDPPKDYVYYDEDIAPHRIYRLDLKPPVRFVTLRERPDLKEIAAGWFHSKWGVPESAYLACMDAYLSGETEYGWYLCLDGERIVGGLGVIENDFHDRPDLTPNVCAVYTEESHRKRGISGTLLNMAVEDLRSKGVSPVYLVTDHTGFYERYGWEFFCMVQGDGEPEPSRMYIHR